MTAARWDVLAEALKWVRTNSVTLEDTRWVFAAGCYPETFVPHGWAAWRANLGFITVRNLMMHNAQPRGFTLAEVLALPAAAASGSDGRPRIFDISVERRIVDPTTDPRTSHSCDFLKGASAIDGRCLLDAQQKATIDVGPSELLILKVQTLIADGKHLEYLE